MITSEDVREELATIAPQRECDRRAELSALFHAAGSLHLRGAGDWALHLDLGSGASARRAFALLRDSGIRSEIRTYRRRAFDTATPVEWTGKALPPRVAGFQKDFISKYMDPTEVYNRMDELTRDHGDIMQAINLPHKTACY